MSVLLYVYFNEPFHTYNLSQSSHLSCSHPSMSSAKLIFLCIPSTTMDDLISTAACLSSLKKKEAEDPSFGGLETCIYIELFAAKVSKHITYEASCKEKYYIKITIHIGREKFQ